MCFAQGSLDQATKPCPMCKVFKPTSLRCPHVKEVCRNRSVHPRYDVVYFKNAEVQTFNGCGYCKWAKVAPSSKTPGYQNAGWPGCCRAPYSNEHRYIQAADWPAVSIVHHIPIPVEVKSILDSIGVPPPRGNTSSPQSPPSSSPTASLGRSTGNQLAGSPPMARRTSTNLVAKADTPSSKNIPVNVLHSGRSGNSPPQTTSSLSRSSRTSLEANPSGASDYIDKRGDSLGRKQTDLDGSLAYRSSGHRPSLSTVLLPSSAGKAVPDQPSDRDRRRTLNVINTNTTTTPFMQRASPPVAGRSKNSQLETSMAGMSISTSPSSASSSSGGSSASSEHTVDGGFTDYLSDESEAELQRQAEIKAALVAQNKMEEQEFRAARQQLADVDLRPPKSWNPDTSSTHSQVRSPPVPSHGPTYVSTSAAFANPSYAHAHV